MPDTLDALDTCYPNWTEATGNLPWGVQRAVHTALQAAADGSIKLCYSSDYRNGSPCLINSVGSMLSVGGGHGIPSEHFGTLVAEFDTINALFYDIDINTENGFVSPMAADILLTKFAPLKERPKTSANDSVEVVPVGEGAADEGYVEKSDADFEKFMKTMLTSDAPRGIIVGTDLFNDPYVITGPVKPDSNGS